jgi:hypothetical protein
LQRTFITTPHKTDNPFPLPKQKLLLMLLLKFITIVKRNTNNPLHHSKKYCLLFFCSCNPKKYLLQTNAYVKSLGAKTDTIIITNKKQRASSSLT